MLLLLLLLLEEEGLPEVDDDFEDLVSDVLPELDVPDFALVEEDLESEAEVLLPLLDEVDEPESVDAEVPMLPVLPRLDEPIPEPLWLDWLEVPDDEPMPEPIPELFWLEVPDDEPPDILPD
ncbi:hypothetical protein [Pontibacter sp. HJ8]